jgi:hypothetical protein
MLCFLGLQSSTRITKYATEVQLPLQRASHLSSNAIDAVGSAAADAARIAQAPTLQQRVTSQAMQRRKYARTARAARSCSGVANAHPSGVAIAGATVVNPVASHENANGDSDSCYRSAGQPLHYITHGASYIAIAAECPATKRVIIAGGWGDGAQPHMLSCTCKAKWRECSRTPGRWLAEDGEGGTERPRCSHDCRLEWSGAAGCILCRMDKLCLPAPVLCR